MEMVGGTSLARAGWRWLRAGGRAPPGWPLAAQGDSGLLLRAPVPLLGANFLEVLGLAVPSGHKSHHLLGPDSSPGPAHAQETHSRHQTPISGGTMAIQGLPRGQESDRHKGGGLLPTYFIKMHLEPTLAPRGMWMTGLRPHLEHQDQWSAPHPPTPTRVWPQPPAPDRGAGEKHCAGESMDVKSARSPSCPQPQACGQY